MLSKSITNVSEKTPRRVSSSGKRHAGNWKEEMLLPLCRGLDYAPPDSYVEALTPSVSVLEKGPLRGN